MTHAAPPKLSTEARALLDAARGGLGPDAATIARMRGRIELAAAGPAPAGVLGKLGLSKLLAVVAIGVAATATATAIRHRGAPAAEPAITPPAVELPAVASATAHESAVVPTPVRPATAAASQPAMAAPPVRPARRASIDLAREVELVDRAMGALRGGDTAAALAAVRLHTTETRGHGQLAEDAAAIEVEALCRRHDPQFTRKLAAFDARWPRSAQRVRLSCR